MIVYKIKDNKIVGISRQANDYVLQANEYGSTIWYLKPFFNGSAVVESITQQEIDDRAELEAEQTALNEFYKELQDGEKASYELIGYIKRLNLTSAQLLNAKKVLLPVYTALKNGMWDVAKEQVALINRPAGALGGVYDKIKARIDNY